MKTQSKISIIVCSRSMDINPEFANNVAESIGVDYEFIWIDNSHNTYSIFSAYNKGIELSNGEFVCFAHEDIRFHTPDWGKKLIAHLRDESVGIAGVYGLQAIADTEDFRVYSPCVVGGLIQDVKLMRQPEISYAWAILPPIRSNSTSNDCVYVDGLFMAARKELFNEIRFDDITYSSFHLYDFDICMESQKVGKRVIVCNDILIEHFSEGVFDDNFARICKVARKKWKSYLPIIRGVDKDNYPKVLHKLQTRKKSNLPEVLQKRLYSPKDEYRKIRTIIKEKHFSVSKTFSIIKFYLNDTANPLKFKIKLLFKFFTYRICNKPYHQH